MNDLQLIPDVMIAGAGLVPAPPGQPQVTEERLNQLWAELSPRHGFIALAMTPDKSGAEMSGPSGDGVTIQPPLVQFRRHMGATGQTLQVIADEAQSVFASVARHLAVEGFFNFGIRHTYSIPLPDNDARGFVLHRILSRREDELAELSPTEGIWGGVKYVIPRAQGGYYTLLVEPLQADDMKSLYLDLDAQFPGQASVDSFSGRAKEAQDYVSGAVSRYLSSLGDLQ